MAYKYNSREQMTFLPSSIEDYIGEDDPVRAYDAFVDALDFDILGITINPNQVGNSAYDPRTMLKLLVYGYSYGWRSSRKLERAVYHNLSFIWLMGGLKPDHKTISEFRKNNKEALAKVLKQCVRLCIELDMIDGNTLFVDGTKIRANASSKNIWRKEQCEKLLKEIDERIDILLLECERIDSMEQAVDCEMKMKKELKDKQLLKTKIQGVLKKFAELKVESFHSTDPEASMMHSIHGSHMSYNAQIVVDEKHGLIVNADTVSEGNDMKQFANQINQANENLGNKCQTAVADAGYACTDELEEIDNKGIKVIVPPLNHRACKKRGKFSKDKFIYDSQNDIYICPIGNILEFYRFRRDGLNKQYTIWKKELCLSCHNFGICTQHQRGRTIDRSINEHLREHFTTVYNDPDSRKIFRLRKEKVELPTGHIKHNLGVSGFLLRGLKGVKAEMSILSSCFNLRRMITLFGVNALIGRLQTFSR